MRYELKNGTLIPYTKRYVRLNGFVCSNPKPERFIEACILEKAVDYDDQIEPREGYYHTLMPYAGDDNLWHRKVDYHLISEEAEGEPNEDHR